MNFAEMLMRPFKVEYPTRLEEDKKLVRSGNPAPNPKWASDARRAKSLAVYRKAMGEEWLTTCQIETRLGYSKGTVSATLQGWYKVGLVERRNVGGGAFNRRHGYEWRVK